MRILAKYIYKYHIHNNTWKLSREYFMSMCHGASADALVANRITCFVCLYKMISMSMLACWQVCYADVEMYRWEKWKSYLTCSFLHHLCANVSMSASMLCWSGDALVRKWKSRRTNFHTWFMCRCRHVGNYEMPTWRCAGGRNIYEYMPPEIYIVCQWWHVGNYFMLPWRRACVNKLTL